MWSFIANPNFPAISTGTGFGFTPLGKAGDAAYGWLGGVISVIFRFDNGIRLTTITFPDSAANPQVYQLTLTYNRTEEPVPIRFCAGGQISVDRAVYGELTEGGSLLPPLNVLQTFSDGLQIHNPNLGSPEKVAFKFNELILAFSCPQEKVTGMFRGL